MDTQIELSDVELDGASTPFVSACASARRQTLSPPSGGGCPDRRRRACCRRRQACACGAQHGLSLDRAPCSLADGKRSGRPRMTPALTHAVQQILARIPVAAHLATYLALLWQFFRFHRYRLRFAFPIRNSYPTDIPRKVPLNCQGSVSVSVSIRPASTPR